MLEHPAYQLAFGIRKGSSIGGICAHSNILTDDHIVCEPSAELPVYLLR
jgi:hypothetical protein